MAMELLVKVGTAHLPLNAEAAEGPTQRGMSE